MKGPIWEGVWAHYRDVPSEGPGFSGETWLANSLRTVEELRSQTRCPGTVPGQPLYRASLLPLVVAMAYEKGVRVLDFGGSVGFGFYPVVGGLPDETGLQFMVVDNIAVCEAGRQFFRDEPAISFSESLPKAGEMFDVVHLGSVLQYIEDWRSLLAALAESCKKFLVFSNLQAGDIPTFATFQHYYGSKITNWFFNAPELIEYIESLGFRLTFRSAFRLRILGLEQPFPMDNFEEKFRLGDPCHLVFQRIVP